MSLFDRSLRTQRGAAALEFALAAPLLLGFIMGVIDLGRFVTDTQRANSATAAVADLASQIEHFTDISDPGKIVTGSEVAVLAATASEVAKPLELFGQGALIVTSVANTGQGVIIAWQRRWGRSDVQSQVSTSSLHGITLRMGEGAVFAEVVYRFQPYLLSGGWLGTDGNGDVHMLAVRRPRLTGPVLDPVAN
jgi:Flp pilus assembly protein TadG